MRIQCLSGIRARRVVRVRVGVRLGTELRNQQCHRQENDDAQVESFSEPCHNVIFDADCPILMSTSRGGVEQLPRASRMNVEVRQSNAWTPEQHVRML